MTKKELVLKAAHAAADKKAEDIKVFDLHGLSSVTDYFVICTGSTDIHVKAIRDEVHKQLKEQGVRPWHVEGMSAANWVLMDYVDFVVHIFQPETREFYSLERLWGDAKIETISEEYDDAS